MILIPAEAALDEVRDHWGEVEVVAESEYIGRASAGGLDVDLPEQVGGVPAPGCGVPAK